VCVRLEQRPRCRDVGMTALCALRPSIGTNLNDRKGSTPEIEPSDNFGQLGFGGRVA